MEVLNGVTNRSRSVIITAMVPLMMPSEPYTKPNGWYVKPVLLPVSVSGEYLIERSAKLYIQPKVDNVRQVELRAPSDPGGRACRGRCHVTVVGTNRCNQCQPIEFPTRTGRSLP